MFRIIRIIKKAARLSAPLFLCALIFLSGFPSEVLVSKVRSYIEDRNVVDLLYLAKKNKNVVDKNILKPSIERAHAANFQMQSGYYIGTGVSQAITNVGFQPQFILIKSNSTTGVGVFKTSAMPAANTAFFSATADNTSSQLSLDSDGFTVGTLANVNTATVRYQWVAFAGSDCTSSGTFCVGQYTGNGAATQTVNTGFQPDLVIVKRTTAVGGHFRVTSHPANRASYFTTTADNTAGGLIQSFTASGFVVGSAIDNVNTATYNFIAFKESSGVFDQGTYTGDGLDNKNISGVGFQPEFVLVKNSTSATTANRSSAISSLETYGDNATAIGDTTASAANIIQGFHSDGFQVGTSVRANESGATFYYAAFAGVTPYSSSGTFTMESGTYTGTGVGFSITGIPFQPDLVIIKENSTQVGVFRIRLMYGDITAYLGAATADFAGGITSIISDGFTIGTSAIVNTNGNTYQWQAFGNAFNPYTNTGASDFAIGVLTGNGVDSRNITRIPWQPDFVLLKRNGASASVIRTSSQAGDLSGFLSATAEAANYVQQFNSDGFQIGNPGNNLNAAGVFYRWFAFKNSDNFIVGNYTGNATDNRDITGVGFQPDLVWIKRSTAVNGVLRPSSLTGDLTQYFVGSANVADRIQTLINDGFQIGGNQTETNTNAGTYRYIAWNGKNYTQQVYRFFENDNSADVGAALAASNTAAELASAGDAFRLRMLLRVDSGNLFASGNNFKLQFAEKSGTCDTAFSGETYTDVTDSTDIAYNTANGPADGASLTANANDPTDGARTIVNQTYEEANNFTNTQAAVTNGQTGKWDFALIDNGAPSATDYCFRIVESDGTVLDSYAVIPQITTADNTPVYSVSITSSGMIQYGFVELSNSSSTLTGYTQTIENDGNTAEKINVKSSNATGGTTWTLASSIGTNIYKHEFSTTSGSVWTTMPDNSTYVSAFPSIAQGAVEDIDFRLTAPSASTDYQQKSIVITIQAVAP